MSVRRNKKWNETKTNDSWSIFKIMGEFVEGYEKLSAIGPCISIFGSARTEPSNPQYKLTVEIAELLSKNNISVQNNRPSFALSKRLAKLPPSQTGLSESRRTNQSYL